MKCPFCSHNDTKVIDSRLTRDGSSTRRRRECLKCKKRFTTYEYMEQVPLMVVKRDGRRQPFDRKKIIGGILKACEKRPVSMDKIEEITAEIERSVRENLIERWRPNISARSLWRSWLLWMKWPMCGLPRSTGSLGT